VTALAPVADRQSRVFDVEITLPNADGRLRPGMIGTVSFTPSAGAQAGAEQLVTIPLSAVVKWEGDQNSYAVRIVEQRGDHQVARTRRVELGEVVGSGVAIESGVTPGDRVIVLGANLVADGDPVRLIP
jgi:multidrug efflux system membrane fusion protein